MQLEPVHTFFIVVGVILLPFISIWIMNGLMQHKYYNDYAKEWDYINSIKDPREQKKERLRLYQERSVGRHPREIMSYSTYKAKLDREYQDIIREYDRKIKKTTVSDSLDETITIVSG